MTKERPAFFFARLARRAFPGAPAGSGVFLKSRLRRYSSRAMAARSRRSGALLSWRPRRALGGGRLRPPRGLALRGLLRVTLGLAAFLLGDLDAALEQHHEVDHLA